jgi:hypothetical protein
MNKIQWFVLGIGLIVFSSFMFTMASPYCNAMVLEGALLTSCYIRRYAFSIPAIISLVLGWIFVLCGFFEPKEKR